MVVGSRTRKASQGSPFVMLGLAAGLVGAGLVGLGIWYYMSQSTVRAHRLRISRGVELLNVLIEPAAQYFYSGKGLTEKNDPLPPEAWAAFKARLDEMEDKDFVDAMVTKSVGADNHFVDAFRYKTGKTALGEQIGKQSTPARTPWYTERGLVMESDRRGIQILEGHSIIGGQSRKVITLRRSILVHPDKPDLEYGKAIVIMLADVPVPGGARPAAPSVPVAQPAPAGDAKPGAQPETKPEAKPAEKPAADAGARK